MSDFWKELLTHKGNGWWNLPKTSQAEPNPKYEGPIGGPWLANWWKFLTHSGVDHAGPVFYTIVAIFLAVVTIVEVWIYTIPTLGGWLNPLLIVLSLFKFIGVVAFFMHLRFDHRYFTYIFTFCMILGVSVFISALLMKSFAKTIQ
ncbi:cytochrome C oxidase subunit IV family protein [Dehalococcoidia bacterium]|nr:cytochrome C oxidase subunit IV family protein [Dehalococcoidia bacterium]|tara:strand:- start:271 stop:708 length:438 start_codon:yes stop_codon:yes gene_type:complete